MKQGQQLRPAVTVSTMADGGGQWETTTEMMGAGNNNLKQ
jgi:hypothetical protein